MNGWTIGHCCWFGRFDSRRIVRVDIQVEFQWEMSSLSDVSSTWFDIRKIFLMLDRVLDVAGSNGWYRWKINLFYSSSNSIVFIARSQKINSITVKNDSFVDSIWCITDARRFYTRYPIARYGILTPLCWWTAYGSCLSRINVKLSITLPP